jgi:peptide chain release factor 1
MELSDELRARLVEKLDAFAERHRKVEALLSDPDVVSNGSRLASVAQEFGHLSKLMAKRNALQAAARRREEALATLADADGDEELELLAREEAEEAAAEEEDLLQDVLETLVSEDKEADRNVIVEIRAGTGGDEAALFAADLLGMYTRYAEKHGWKVDVIDASPTDLGGMREVDFSVTGKGAWRTLRYESGGHRVQRVPETESQGRIHTSLATVAVMPEAEEVDVDIDPGDIDMSFMRSSGPGGQHVNKTSSCVRLVHKPTGITVRCQDEKNQHANRKKAMMLLRAKIYDLRQREAHAERDAIRRSQVGSGDRNERIRTYNFPQDRITDHRIGFDEFGIESFLMGNCDDMFEALAAHDREARVRDFIESEGASPAT